MTFANDKKEYFILGLTQEQLRYRLTRLGAMYTFAWIKK